MTMEKKEAGLRSHIQTILFWGALWGIFEATVGYALHLVPWKIGSYIWFPAAYFIMARVYEATRKRQAVVAVAIISAAIKLLNLFSPMRPDYVINPAVSIVLESLAMVCILSITRVNQNRRTPLMATVMIFSTNTLWRLIYTIYLAFLVPTWMRKVSVVRDMGVYLSFILRENLISAIACAVTLWVYSLMKDEIPGARIAHMQDAVRNAATVMLLCCSVLLQFIL